MKITRALEDYLETILLLQKKENRVRLTDVAGEMNVAKSSAHMAIQNLQEKGLVIHEKYGTLFLTEEGKREAEIVYFRHTSLKSFFINVLGLDEKMADDEACKVEHVLSDSTIEKMTELAKKKKI